MAALMDLEAALDGGRLEVKMASGFDRWWTARRNGATQTWKTRPDHYSIPIKLGLRTCARLNQTWDEGTHYRIKQD